MSLGAEGGSVSPRSVLNVDLMNHFPGVTNLIDFLDQIRTEKVSNSNSSG